MYDHWIVYRRHFTLPPECAKKPCSLLLGDVEEGVAIALNGHVVHEGGLFPPGRSLNQLYPVVATLPTGSPREGSRRDELTLHVYGQRFERAGPFKGPLAVMDASLADGFARVQTSSVVFAPLACALALCLIAATTILFGLFYNAANRTFLCFYGLYCLANIAFLISFSDIGYHFMSLKWSVILRFVSRRLSDFGTLALLSKLICFEGWSEKVYRAAFRFGTVVTCLMLLYIAYIGAVSHTGLDTLAAVQKFLDRAYLAKFFPFASAFIASWFWPRYKQRLAYSAIFVGLTLFLVYDSALLLSLPYGDYGSRFHMLLFALIYGSIAMRKSADVAAKHRAELEKDAAIGRNSRQVAHDIRSPLAALSMVTRNASRLEEDERLVLRAAADRISNIADDLLHHARTGEQPAESDSAARPIEILDTLEGLAVEARVRWSNCPEVEIATKFSPQDYGAFIRADTVQFKRAIANVINNGVEACGKRGRVSLELSVDDLHVVILIKDSGRGMPASVIARLGQVGNTEGKSDGNGLGIHHAFHFARKHGGFLEYASQDGQGTVAAFQMARITAPAWFTLAIKIYPGQDVLILDDDDSIHQVWRRRLSPLLNSQGGEIFHFRECTSFRAEARTNAGALCLVDFELLGTNATGLDLIDDLSIAQQSILVTSHAEDEKVQRRCQECNISLLSKKGAAAVPIISETASRDADYVILDDDRLVHTAWRLYAKQAGKHVLLFQSSVDLLRCTRSLDKEVPIHVDLHLSDKNSGLDVCRQLSERGFENLYLATGEVARNIPPCPWVKGIIGKGPHGHTDKHPSMGQLKV